MKRVPFLALLVASALPAVCAPVINLLPQIIETDSDVVHNAGSVTIPAAPSAQSWDLMTLGNDVTAGRDYTRFRQTIATGIGESATVPVQMTVTGDSVPELDGDIHLIYKPSAVSWAESLPPVRELTEFTGVQRILSWKNGLVWLTAAVNGEHRLQAWRRTEGGLVRIVDIRPPSNDIYRFETASVQIGTYNNPTVFADGKLVIFNLRSGVVAYGLDDASPQGWFVSPPLTGPINPSTDVTSFGLWAGLLYGGGPDWGPQLVRRWDITNPQRWTIYGFSPAPNFSQSHETMDSMLGPGSRIGGTDFLWNFQNVSWPQAALGGSTSDFTATSDGFITRLAGEPSRLLAATETATGWIGAVAPLNHRDASSNWRGMLAAGDGIVAVGGIGKYGTTTSTVNLILRDDSDPATLLDAGSISFNDRYFGSRVFLDGRDFVIEAASYPPPVRYYITSFPGTSLRLKDDDGTRLTIHDRTIPEPEQGSETLQIEVTIPLEARQAVNFTYEITAGSAVSGQDFTPVTGTATIPAGAWRTSIPVEIKGDDAAEDEKTMRVRILSTDSGRLPLFDGTITVVDSDDRPAVRVEPRPVLEGQPAVSMPVIVNQPSQLTAGGLDLEVNVTGHADPASAPSTQFLAGRGDIRPLSENLTLSDSTPRAEVRVSAPDDSEQENGTEEAALHLRKMGMPFISAGYALRSSIKPSTSSIPPRISAGGDWLFFLNSPNSQSITTVDAYQRTPEGWQKRQEVISRGFFNPDIRIATDGNNLAVVEAASGSAIGPAYTVQIFRQTGPASAPWQPVVSFLYPSQSMHYQEYLNCTMAGDVLSLHGALLARVSGDRDWRWIGYSPVTPDQKFSGFDGDSLAVLTEVTSPTAAPTSSLRTYRRSRARMGALETVSLLHVPAPIASTGVFPGKISGNRLTVIGWDSIYIYARLNGTWVQEAACPAEGYGVISGFSGDLLRTQKDIFMRSGSGPGSWSRHPQSATPGIEPTFFNRELLVLAGPGYLQMWEPGARIEIHDDDSFGFGYTIPIPAQEKAGEESSVRVKFHSLRPAPVPISMRVRTRSVTATEGEDFLPAVKDLIIYPPGQEVAGADTSDVVILPDRRLEGPESFEFTTESISFGAGRTYSVGINDLPLPALPAGGFVLREPPVGTHTQYIRIPLEYTTDRPLTLSLHSLTTGVTATSGADYTIPASLTVAAGTDSISIPVSVAADALSESVELMKLLVQPMALRVDCSITDSTAPGIQTGSYTMMQNTGLIADGDAGHPMGLGGLGSPGGQFRLLWQAADASVALDPSGNFGVSPAANFIGELLFGYEVGSPVDLLGEATVWRYLHPTDGVDPKTTEPSFTATWKTGGRSLLPWRTGTGALSYGGFGGFAGTDIGVPPSGKRYTAYFHTTFNSPVTATVPLELRLAYDDGVVIYVNGTERARQLPGTSSFSTAADTYQLLTNTGGITDADEAIIRTVPLGQVPVTAGANHLAISLHNSTATSSDLGLKLLALHMPRIAGPAAVRVAVTDGQLPPVVVPDTYTCPQNRLFQSGDAGSAGLLENDGLLRPDGTPYDAITEILVQTPAVGVIELLGLSGHFRFTPPAGFTGAVPFSYQVRDKDGLSLPVAVICNVIPGLPFDIWKEDLFPAQGGFSIGDNEDPDSDGAGLLLEYALLNDPLSADSPDFLTALPPPSRPSFSATLRKAADLATVIEFAEDPGATAAWTEVLEQRGGSFRNQLAGARIAFTGETSDRVTVTISGDGADRRFWRVRVRRLTY